VRLVALRGTADPEVDDRDAADGEGVGDEAAMAAPPVELGAHEGEPSEYGGVSLDVLDEPYQQRNGSDQLTGEREREREREWELPLGR